MTTLEFTLTVNNCLGCHFCPQQKLAAAYQSDKRRMTMEDFHTILGKLPLDVTTDFSGYSEPLLNPFAGRMMRSAAQRGHTVRLFTTLVGLNEEQMQHLTDTDISFIRLHAPDKEGLKYDADKWLVLFKMFTERIGKPFTVMAMGPVEPRVLAAVEASGHELELPPMLSRAANLWEINEIQGPVTCAMNRYHQNVVLPNGDVWGCCMCYDGEIKLGNLMREPYRDIFERAEKWEQDKNPPADSPCRRCEWARPA